MKKTAIALASVLLAAGAAAQAGKTSEGYALQWDKTISVIPDSLQNGAFKLPAWTIAVHEAEAGAVMGWWMADMQAVSASVAKTRPAKAMGLRLPAVPEAAMAAASAAAEKRAGLVKLTVAFALNDSTPTSGNEGQEAYMRTLAVKYNRAAVQAQVEGYERQLAKAGDKLSSSKGDVAKSQSRITKYNSELEKIKAKRGRIQRDNAKVSGNIAGLEKKTALSGEAKDLKRLTKARQRLVKGESALAKLMEKEAKVQGGLAKEHDRLERSSGKAEDRGATKEEIQRTLDALRRKFDAIQ